MINKYNKWGKKIKDSSISPHEEIKGEKLYDLPMQKKIFIKSFTFS